MASFGERLQALRKHKGLTQKQMAELFGMTERGFRSYENNQSTPHYDTLVKLADYFNVTLDYLTGRADDPDAIDITSRMHSLLSDSRLSLEAKGLFVQLQHFAVDNKNLLDQEKFLQETRITKNDFDGIINELESLGYLKIESALDGETSRKFYVLT